MSWFSRLFGFADLPSQTYQVPAGGIQSPWSDPGELVKVVVSDILGLVPGDDFVSRAQAMQVPAVARGRGLVTGLARYPLKAYEGEQEVAEQPAWLSRTNGLQQPRQRVLWSLDDMLFNGHALWKVERSGDQIVDAARVPPGRWKIDQDGVWIDTGTRGQQRLMGPSEYIYLPGPQDPLLAAGALAIRTAHAIQRGTSARASSPVPLINLQLDEGVTREEALETQAEWVKARQSPNGAVAVTTPGITANEMGTQGADFLESARNASRLDVANVVGIPASELDGSLSTSTLTYSTSEGNRSRLNDSLLQWQTAVEDALSSDNVVPQGQRVAFDLTEHYGPPTGTGPALED